MSYKHVNTLSSLSRTGYAEATKLASLAPHTGAVEPRCAYFGPCGGCTLQSLDYSRQLVEKRNQVGRWRQRWRRQGRRRRWRRRGDGRWEERGWEGRRASFIPLPK